MRNVPLQASHHLCGFLDWALFLGWHVTGIPFSLAKASLTVLHVSSGSSLVADPEERRNQYVQVNDSG